MLRRAGICVAAGLAVACGGHHADPDARCGRPASDVAFVYWDVGVYGGVALGIGGWYDPYTDDAWGDGTLDDGAPDEGAPDDGSGGDQGAGSDGDVGGDDGENALPVRIAPQDIAPSGACHACALTCVYAAAVGQANAVSSIGASDVSYAAACANAQREIGRWSRPHRVRIDACRAAGAGDRVPARPEIR